VSNDNERNEFMKKQINSFLIVLVFTLRMLMYTDNFAKGSTLYQFTNIVNTTGQFDYFENVSLNNSGTVAFDARLRGQTWGGVYVGNGGPLTTIADITQFSVAIMPAINDAGTVAFYGGNSGSSGIYTGTGGPLTTIASGPPLSVYSPSINNSGIVAFRQGSSVCIGNGGPVTTLYCPDARFSGTGFPSINDAGVVVFIADLNAGGTGIYTGNGGPVTTIAEAGSGLNAVGVQRLSNNGSVVFLAQQGTGQLFDAVCVGNGGLIQIVADAINGPFSGFGAPSINSHGGIAFMAAMDAGGYGMFTGPDLNQDKVVVSGDNLFGSMVSRIGNCSINDNGQVAFYYELQNGVSGVAIASPIPEPSTIILLGIGAFSILAWNWRRNRKAA
jgi:hypothetical protein